MSLPKATTPEQAQKREKAAAKSPGPAPEKAFTLPSKHETGPRTVTPAPGGGDVKGEQKTEDGKIETGPLDSNVRASLEKTFGTPLGHIIVHQGPGVDAQCAKRGAIAFAKGNEISISSGAGQPGSKGWLEVVGHEVTHTLQSAGNSKANDEKSGKKSSAGSGKETKPEDVKADGGKGGKESEADAAGAKAAEGAKAAPVTQKASAGETQNKDAEPPKHANPNTFKIPIGKRNIEFVPPNKNGDWSLGVGDVKDFVEGKEKKVQKWWNKSIPTPFFGLCVDIGAFVFAEFKSGAVSLKSVKVNYKKATGTYEIEGEVSTGLSVEIGGGVNAGVSADVWIASAGVGVKAKLALSASRTLSATIMAGYSPKTNQLSFNANIGLKALEIEAKAAVALYAYYDAVFVSTYCKEWTLWERTLGKMSFGGVEAFVGKEPGKPIDYGIKPKEPDIQSFGGNIKNMFPSKS